MKIKFAGLIFLTFISLQKAQAQYDRASALGIKAYPGAVTFKQYLGNGDAFEALAYFWKGARVTGLYEIQYRIEGVKGLSWYIGPGAHLSIYDPAYFKGKVFAGIDGVLGLDLRFQEIPFNISLDWQPSLDFGEGSSNFEAGFGGLSIRYIFN